MALVLGMQLNESATLYTSDGPIKIILIRTGPNSRIAIEAPAAVKIVRNTLEHHVSPSQVIKPNSDKEPACPKEPAARNTSGSSSSTTSSAISKPAPLARFFGKQCAD
jgi:sRNA-binding carbon storage regulator CsrA